MKKVVALLALFSVAVFAQNTFTDLRDGKKYKSVKIGEQTWMAENLNYDAKDLKSYGNSCYSNKPANCGKYGRLYDYEVATKVCPKDWHLPSDKEWQTLVDFAGGEKIAVKKLKAKSGWNKKGNGTDDYGFSALPGGTRSSDGGSAFVGDRGYWWSASEAKNGGAYYHGIDSDSMYKYEFGMSEELSVRCVQD